MALTRKFLASKGLEADVIEEIIEAHTETVTGLKDQISEYDKYKQDSEELAKVKKELSDLKKKVNEDSDKDKDYEKLKQEYEDYKKSVEDKAIRASKEEAYKAILKDAGISEKHFEKILKYSDIDSVELDEKGKITTAKDILKAVKEEWSDHIESNLQRGADVSNPPANNGAKEERKSRALERATKYHNNLYGSNKEE